MNRRAFLSIPLKPELPTLNPLEKANIPIVSMLNAGFPREYARHTWILIENAHAWLCRDEMGFYAVDATCPHLGGLVNRTAEGFICRCHGSLFRGSGVVIRPPAKQALRCFRVDLNPDGKLIIQRDQVVSPDERFIA